MSQTAVAAILFDLDGTLVRCAHRRSRDASPDPVRAEPQVVAAIRSLAARHPVGVLTDGGSARQRAKLRASGLLPFLAAVVISGEVRAQKPSRKIFDRALEVLGAAPGSVLYVGDDPRRDIAGARAAGLRTCWVANGREWASNATPPDLIIESVGDLPELLAC